MHDVLLLNTDGSPLGVVPWERAVCLLLDRRVHMVAGYADRLIRSPSLTMAWPAVVSLVRYVPVRFTPRLNRVNLLARDRFTCQYCGVRPRTPTGRPDLAELTLDHVVPRARAVGGRVVLPWTGRWAPLNSWQNLVAACRGCNLQKGARTPAEARMPLRARPRRPTTREGVRILLARENVPEEWRAFL